jgi:large subunit ribosomal protein L25
MEAILEANVRSTFGKNEARRTRRAGKVPAIVYGAGSANEKGKRTATPIAVEPKPLLKILRSGANTLISLKIDGGSGNKVLVKEYQLDPVTHAVLHADFYQVAMDRALQVTIPIIVKGEAKGVKVHGGILEFVRREIEVECLPGDIPEHVEIDVTELLVHQGIRVRDIATDPKWKPISEPDLMLVHVIQPKAEEVAAAPTEAAPVAGTAEPEVIKKGKKEEEGADKDKK